MRARLTPRPAGGIAVPTTGVPARKRRAPGWVPVQLAQHGFGYATLVVVALLIGVPVATVLIMSLRTGLPGQAGPLTLANYERAYVANTEFATVLLNTLVFAFGTVAVALLFAVPLVWLFNRTDLPFKDAIFVSIIAGFLIPVFLGSIGWILMFSPQIGLVNQLARQVFGLQEAPFDIYNLPGMAVVQGVSLVPAAFFMLSAAFRAMDPVLDEASYTSGAGKLRTMLRIDVPLARPAIMAAMIYLFMLAVSLFEVPAIIGWPARIFVLSSSIFFAVNPNVGLPSYGLAGAYGMLMVGMGLLLAYFYFQVVRQARRYSVVTGRGYRPKLLSLGKWKYAALGFVAFYLSLALALPLSALLWVSFLPHVQAPSLEALAELTFANYLEIPSRVGATPFLNTLILVVLAPTLAITISILVSWTVVRHRFPLRGALDAMAFLPNAVPHILFVVALAYLALAFRDMLPIYGSIFLIVLAYGATYVAYGSRTLNSAMIQIHQELEESARVCGSTRLRVLRRILLPLIAGAVFNAWLWIALLSYREVTMALVLRSRESEVLSTLIWEMWQSGLATQVAALGVILFVVVLIVSWAARRLFTYATQGYTASG